MSNKALAEVKGMIANGIDTKNFLNDMLEIIYFLAED